MCKMRAKFVRIAENQLSLARVVWILDTTTALERELMMFPFTSFMLQMWEMKSSCWILYREAATYSYSRRESVSHPYAPTS